MCQRSGQSLASLTRVLTAGACLCGNLGGGGGVWDSNLIGCFRFIKRSLRIDLFFSSQHSYLFPLLDVLYRQVGNLIVWTLRFTEILMAASNHIVAAIREFGTQWHQREMPSFSISETSKLFSQAPVKRCLIGRSWDAARATFKVSRYLK